LDWSIPIAIAAVAAIGVMAVLLRRPRERRHPAGPPATGRHFRANTQPEDPLHQRAKHYLASGALPRWDP
jgi:hypothetical protein